MNSQELGGDDLGAVIRDIQHDLDLYERGISSLPEIASSLGAWARVLESRTDCAESLTTQFRDFRSEIEIVNAIWLNSGNAGLTEVERQDVVESIHGIAVLLEDELRRLR